MAWQFSAEEVLLRSSVAGHQAAFTEVFINGLIGNQQNQEEALISNLKQV